MSLSTEYLHNYYTAAQAIKYFNQQKFDKLKLSRIQTRTFLIELQITPNIQLYIFACL